MPGEELIIPKWLFVNSVFLRRARGTIRRMLSYPRVLSPVSYDRNVSLIYNRENTCGGSLGINLNLIASNCKEQILRCESRTISQNPYLLP